MLRRATVILFGLLGLHPATAVAQTVTLTVSNAGSLMQNATLADYGNGYIVDDTPVSYTVTLSGSTSVCATVALAGATNAAAAKGLSDVTWGTNATIQNAPLSTNAATVASHFLTTSSRTATGTVYFKTSLAWADGPQTYLGPSLTFSVTGRRMSNQNQCT